MEIVIIFLLILLNGFFALSEIAIVSSKKMRLEVLKDEKKKGAKYALKLLDNSENFLSSIQVGITLVSFITGFYGGTSVAQYLTPFFEWLGVPVFASYKLSVVSGIILITYFAIVIGELVPKTIALSEPEKYAVRIAPVIFVISKIFYPVVKGLSASTK
ncbi:MAG: CNNM domain-containing protein, partial [Bacteroidales bacterium]